MTATETRASGVKSTSPITLHSAYPAPPVEPQIALVTTTIHVPDVLRLYRACAPNAMFFVMGDRKSPDLEIVALLDDVPNHVYMGIDRQHDLGYACSRLIGENTIARRNIGTLEALRWGADIIVFIDDDNIPLSTDYFDRFELALGSPFSGCAVYGFAGWFDPGRLLLPPAPHRGFPHDIDPLWSVRPVVDARVGVAAGMCLGDPDVSAVTRIANHPHVHGVSELLRAGFVVDPQTRTVFNSQNTAFLRELAPAFLMVPQWGRYDDIYAGLIAQRVMRHLGLCVHFGQPLVYQQRNPHDLVKDLRAELDGMAGIRRFADGLDGVHFDKETTALDCIRRIYRSTAPFITSDAGALGAAWCADVEKVL